MEHEEFRQIYDRQLQRVYRLSLVYLKNVFDAEDAVQNIFLKVLEKQPVFQDEKHETAWFVTVTRNYCRDVLRSFWKRNRIALEAIEEMGFEQFTTEDNMVFSTVMSLPSKYREVLYLYYYEEYSIREMSLLLKRKESTIQTQLAAGRKRMKVLLKKQGIGKEEVD